ncbi:hypothetical protein MesoLj131c_71370 (plasmid) [Mesorhizobium sp. 131-3-5]|nr:hypothetical protein MesoLj131c_71370 [Mesorhizobium sp. 131-3-5]
MPLCRWSHHTPKITHLQRGSDGTVIIISVTNSDNCELEIFSAIEAAAGLFENHPHSSVFPGDGVDTMPFLTEPAS